MNVALYARVSKLARINPSEDQKRDQNPEVQLRELREWSKREGHKVIAEYVDRASGKNMQRPQLQKLMRDVRAGNYDIDAVVVWRLDRFGRSVLDLHSLIAELQAAKVSFICQRDNFDLTSSIGKVIFGILAVFAEFERNVIAERTKAGLALARSEGRLPGRKIDPKRGPSRTTRWRQKQRKTA
jgi:DNA invertase Pin-like site-specific DNA recombinase